MRITQIMEKYKVLFLIIFIVTIFGLIFNGIKLFDSTIISLILSTIVITVKYYVDKLFIKIEKKWFSKSKH